MTTLASIVFWVCALAIVYAQVGYPFVLRVLVTARRGRETLGGPRAPRPLGLAAPPEERPLVSLIIPAYDEEDVIADKVANALRLDWPRERLQIIVADDGSTDSTPERAREAGADLVLELPPGGKVAALNEAVSEADGEILAFSDANSEWAPDALAELLVPFADDRVGYVCGQVRFLDPEGDNLEGAELWIVGNPRMSVEPLHEAAALTGARVRFVTRFVEDAEIPAIFRRADVVALPYLDAEHSGVLYTGLAFGKPMVVSAVGGFPEVAEHGAARLVPPGDTAALAAALRELIDDPAAREELAAAARAAAAGPYSWDEAARMTLALYEELLARPELAPGPGGGAGPR